MKELERQYKALANRRRLAILKFLKEKKEASVGEISDKINLSFKSTSRHLSVLLASNILEKDQRNIQMYYHIAPNQRPSIQHALSLL